MPVIEYAHSPQRMSPTQINIWVKFTHFYTEVPFTAASDDCTDYGREIYQQAADGQYGELQEGEE